MTLQAIVSGNEFGVLMVGSGMTIVFFFLFILSTYMIRLNLRKAFEQLLLTEKSAATVTTIFNSMADSILLISKEQSVENEMDQTMR